MASCIIRANLNTKTLKINTVRFLTQDGGNDSGHVSDAGQVWKERERSAENIYFKKLEKEQIKNLRKAYQKEIDYHQKEISRHADLVKEHKDRLKKLIESSDKHDDD